MSAHNAEYVLVSREDLRRTLEHLDYACVQLGGEPCAASFVGNLRRALLNDGDVSLRSNHDANGDGEM